MSPSLAGDPLAHLAGDLAAGGRRLPGAPHERRAAHGVAERGPARAGRGFAAAQRAERGAGGASAPAAEGLDTVTLQ